MTQPCSYSRLEEAEAEINRLDMEIHPESEPEFDDPQMVPKGPVGEAVELLRTDHESAAHWGACPSCRALALLEEVLD